MKKYDIDCVYIEFNYLRIMICGGLNFVDFMDYFYLWINIYDEKWKKGILFLIIFVNFGFFFFFMKI